MIREIDIDKNNREVDTIMDIWLESTIEAHQFIDKDYWQKKYQVVKNEYLPQSKTYVYTKGDDIEGFISIINKEFIGALFVKTTKQGNGIGSKLIKFAKERYNALSLAVYVENKSAVSFYKSMGFDIVFKQENEDSHIPEYVMSTKSKKRK